MPRKSKKRAVNRAQPAARAATKNHMPLAVVGFILNLFLPGLGSIVGGKVRTGIWQVILFLIGAFLYLYFEPLGGVLSFAAFIWGIVTGVVLIQEARK
jgi:TM2 domain-containing membrane protein YozV